jgi:hypothetical protein
MRGRKRIWALAVALMLPASSTAQSGPAPDAEPDSAENCPVKSLLLNFDVRRFGQVVGQFPIWRLGEEDTAFFFSAGMAIDADGAPNAYNAQNTGLDDLSNAGQPGHWDGVLQDQDGNPIVQGPDDPFPGYYISCTALADWTKDRLDPARFVDASKIPYIALPGELARSTGARLGDLATVFNTRNGKFSHAIFADIGALGEGSIALADNLGIWSDARAGGAWGGLVYVVFPGSGDHRPKSVEEINEIAAKFFQEWGGTERVRSCADRVAWRHSPWPGWIAAWGVRTNEPPASSASESKLATDIVRAARPHATTN